jgi:hypothetical protein
MSLTNHVTHWGSWGGTTLAIRGFISGEKIQTYLGIATAIAFSALGSYGYLKATWIYWQLKWQRSRDDFRREQQLLDARNRAEIEKIERDVATSSADPPVPAPAPAQ